MYALEFYFVVRQDLIRAVALHHAKWPQNTKPTFPSYHPGSYLLECEDCTFVN